MIFSVPNYFTAFLNPLSIFSSGKVVLPGAVSVLSKSKISF